MKGLNEKDCEEIKSSVGSFTGIERRYFRYLTIKYCSIKGKPLSEYPIVNILGYDEITTMTIVRDVDNDFDCVMELVKKTKDHAQWEIDEEYFLQQEEKETIKTEEEALASLDPSDDFALDYIPEELRTARVCLEAVKQSPEALMFVPDEQMTVELCLEAVKQYGWALKYMPEKFMTAEVCLEAVKQCDTALGYVPRELRTAEVCLEAVKHFGVTLIYVPRELKTAELCLEAVKNNCWVLDEVPKALRDEVQRKLER